MSEFARFSAVAAAAVLLATNAQAAVIAAGDVTTSIGPNLFVDDARPGGNDIQTTNGNSPRNIGPRFWDLDYSGAIDAGDLVAGTVTVTGFGFASNANATQNSATSVSLEFIYLGLDGALGGGDDVSLGSETVSKTFAGAGEYFVNFDTPLSAAIDGLNNKFMVVADTNGTGAFVIKAQPLQFETFDGPKLSVAGTFVAVPEPASLALLGAGSLMIAGRRRRA